MNENTTSKVSVTLCQHNWLPVERIDLPAEPGYVTNVRKLYCPNCREFHIIDYDKLAEPLEDNDE